MSSTLLHRPLLVADVPPKGKRFTIEMSEAECVEIAKILELPKVSAVRAELDVQHFGEEGLEVRGTIHADVTQTCVVSLDPFDSHQNLDVDIRFSPDGIDPFDDTVSIEDLVDENAVDPPDKLVDGQIDLGQIVFEFLALGLDPYPRKPGAVFEEPPAEDETRPFAALRALKRDR